MVNKSGIKLENGKPVQITTANSFSGKYVALKANLNFKSKLSYQDSERTDFGDINGNANDGNTLINEMTTGMGFKPIGISNSFLGTFDGENKETEEIYKISNIYINTTNYAGLFGVIAGNAIIKNIEILGEIKGGGHTGGIVGEVKTVLGNISNCTNRANIEGYNMVGGIIGYNYANTNVVQCKNYGTIAINGSEWAYSGIGGIIGCDSSGTGIMEACENYGKIGTEDSGIPTGGIIGVINTTSEIDNCSNYGEIISNSRTGGIAGWHRNGENVKIYNSRNLGNIKGAGVGGIIGSSAFAANRLIGSCYIENSYNTGKLQATGNVGGIVASIGGYAYKDLKAYIDNCYNIGELTGNVIGGIVRKY